MKTEFIEAVKRFAAKGYHEGHMPIVGPNFSLQAAICAVCGAQATGHIVPWYLCNEHFDELKQYAPVEDELRKEWLGWKEAVMPRGMTKPGG